ncbi:MAG: hypothetical protein ACR2HD_05835 [Solirubrobacteraceae bacterium]
MPQTYYNRRRRERSPRHARLELAVSAFVLIVAIVMLLVFLFDYHDVPLRVSGGY